MTWFFFALATPALFSAGNFVDKFLISKKLPSPLILTILTCAVTGIIGLIIGMIYGFKPLIGMQLPILVLAGIFLALYIVPYFKALNSDDTSKVASLFQFVPVFTIILSYLFLNETLGPKVLFGFILIFIGGFILMADKLDFSFLKPRPALWLMLLSSFLYVCANILYRFVARNQDFWPSLYYELIGMGIGAIFLFLFLPEKMQFLRQAKTLKPVLKLIFIGDLFNIPARMTNAYAFAVAPAAYVSIVGNSQPLFLLLFGLVLSQFFPKIIKEDISRQTILKKLVNVAFILSGLALIYF